MIHLGIDIAKLKFDVALLAQGKFKTKVFANDSAGISACLKWLGTHADYDRLDAHTIDAY